MPIHGRADTTVLWYAIVKSGFCGYGALYLRHMSMQPSATTAGISWGFKATRVSKLVFID